MIDGFVYLDGCVPYCKADAKYFGTDNFVGRRVDGYMADRVVGTRELASALARAAEETVRQGLGFMLWDAYRPARAVAHFVRWANSPEDGLTKSRHYPRIDKADMISEGYVSAKSSHSRGSAVDLTLYDLNTGKLLDMGGDFDFMDISSHHGFTGISREAFENRELLKSIMERNGFEAYENEWWHYRLTDEKYKDTYFDFPIE